MSFFFFSSLIFPRTVHAESCKGCANLLLSRDASGKSWNPKRSHHFSLSLSLNSRYLLDSGTALTPDKYLP